MANIVITGASSGLGLGLAKALPVAGDTVWMLSRTKPAVSFSSGKIQYHWIQADLSTLGFIEQVKQAIGEKEVDLLLHVAGTWESGDLSDISAKEIQDIMNVNVTSFLVLACQLASNVKRARNAKIIAVSSTAGLDNATGPRAVYSASKMGLKGGIHGLRQYFRNDAVSVTCISPGGIASDVDVDAGVAAALEKYQNRRIPIGDFVQIIRTIQSLSPASCVKEIILPAQFDEV